MKMIVLNANFLRVIMIGLLLSVLAGCGARNIKLAEGGEPAQRPVSEFVSEDKTYWIDEYDPWEGFNRSMYKFNARFDQYIFLPVVRSYRFITPGFVRTGLSNFFANLGEIENLVNNILQLKPLRSLKTVGRFGINTTMGLGGTLDPATVMGLPEYEEDFGQTLGRYGVGAGPYLVLPIAGPSNLRDTTGSIVDLVVYNAIVEEIDIVETWREDSAREIGTALMKGIVQRDDIEFRYYQTGSPFEYELVRKLYLAKRKMDIER